jgi:hypothetical protein
MAEENAASFREQKERKGRSRKHRPAWIYLAVALAVIALVAVCAIFLTGGKVSGKPVPGHPDWRIVSLPIYYENGTAIEILENRKAISPSYGTLISFLSDYGPPRGEYGSGHICSSYSVELYDAAERTGINARMVLVYFVGVMDPHSIVAFDTTDNGRVYIDLTGLTPQEKAMGYPDRFRIADVTPGETYRLRFTSPYEAMVEDTGLIIDRISMLS